MTKLIDLDAVLGEPAIVTLNGKKYRVNDPPMEEFFALQSDLDKMGSATDVESLKKLNARFATLTGIPVDRIGRLSIRQHRVLLRELVLFFTSAYLNRGENESPLAGTGKKGKAKAKTPSG